SHARRAVFIDSSTRPVAAPSCRCVAGQTGERQGVDQVRSEPRRRGGSDCGRHAAVCGERPVGHGARTGRRCAPDLRTAPCGIVSRLWRNRRAFAGITVVGIRTFFTYRSLVTFFMVSMLLQVYLLKVVWTAIYGSQPRIDGVSIQTLIVYLTLTN